MRPWSKYELIELTTFPKVGRGRRPHDVYLEGCDVDRELCVRLGRLIEETWARIPKGEREMLRRHWRKGDRCGRGISFAVMPVLYMVNMMRDEAIDHPIITFGVCDLDGNYVRLWAPYVQHADDDAVRALLAHELAHSVLRALHLEYDSEDVEHHDVGRMVLEWGFSESRIDAAWRKNAPAPLRAALTRAMRRGQAVSM